MLIVEDIKHNLPALHDDGSKLFSDRLEELTERYSGKTNSAIHSEVLKALADAVEAQPALAYKMRDQQQTKIARQLADGDITSRIGEAGLQTIKNHPEDRAALLEFLSKPLTPDSIHAARATLSTNAGFFRDYMSELQNDALGKFHQDFWDAPLSARTALLTDVVFPRAHHQKHLIILQIEYLIDYW